ncbi:hypothetical protein NPX13_g9486 [Xylaria arbuscula]|uniref:Uncharacterized protein n=1 Tax=Xylaria arbuscula TaxID=114810 RepID=A0A9W8THN2_9PEZI|nr:hypothetical protein NPX13_g9486 [Xylaria arbuscula]
MLLTASQVSVLLTCGIVLLCTSALFISGAIIQQRTLRDLRHAIKPAIVTRPKPKSWDLEALKKRTTTIKLEDGTLVEIQSRQTDPELTPENSGPEAIEVRPTVPEDAVVVPIQKQDEAEHSESDHEDGSPLNVKPAWDGVQEGGEPLSRAERRRRIKAEIQRLSRGDTPVYYQRRLW